MKGQKFFPLLVVAAGLLAYHNSFTGPFIFDDVASIPENPTIRHLWPLRQCLSPPQRGGLTVEGRPIINLSLAINYALGGYDVWGYHALNLTVHILAGLTLMGIVRRTLRQPVLSGRFGAVANELALAVAVLWMVHPLQTESVTYVIQRAESIMGLFYLLTLYCFIRGVESPWPRLWYSLCVGACALGMASKEVMVSAPLIVLLYDRAFLSNSFREAWHRRRRLYLALASTWILLGYMAILTLSNAFTNAQGIGLTWWQYLATEPKVILYYLRLSVWPHPICLDHAWPMANTWMSILPPTIVIVILLGATAWAWRKHPVWGFIGACLFLILAPSSSIVPAHSAIYEHRMYLSLASVVSLVVMGLYLLMGRRSLAVFALMAIGLGVLTWRRNQDYRSEVTIWQDAVAKYPGGPSTHYNLGVGLGRAGRVQEAIVQYEQALRMNPDFAEAHNSLGTALYQIGKDEAATKHFEQALRIDPDYAEAHNNLGTALAQTGKIEEAIPHYEQALRIKPDYAEAHNNLGIVLVKLGKVSEGIAHYEQALRLKPDYAEAHNNLGNALAQTGNLQEAIKQWEQALRIRPDYAEAHCNLGVVLARLRRMPEAIGHWEQALRIEPYYANAHYSLAMALELSGRKEEAIAHYEQVLLINPKMIQAQNRLARLRAAQ